MPKNIFTVDADNAIMANMHYASLSMEKTEWLEGYIFSDDLLDEPDEDPITQIVDFKVSKLNFSFEPELEEQLFNFFEDTYSQVRYITSDNYTNPNSDGSSDGVIQLHNGNSIRISGLSPNGGLQPEEFQEIVRMMVGA